MGSRELSSGNQRHFVEAGSTSNGDKMEDETIETVVIDPRLSSYNGFFDLKWAERILTAVEGSLLKPAVNSLVVAWRSTNGSHRLPSLIVQSLQRFADAEPTAQLQARALYAERLAHDIAEKLEARMQYGLNFDQRRSLRRAVAKIEQETFEAAKLVRLRVKFDCEGYWKQIADEPEFRFCLIGTQGLNYGGLFFDYEDFLASVIRTKKLDFDSKKKQIGDALAKHLGEPLRAYCWADPEVDVAMQIRHALVHNGGRYRSDRLDAYASRFVHVGRGDELELKGEQFLVMNGKIQISPRNTSHLFEVLKERVSKIVDELA